MKKLLLSALIFCLVVSFSVPALASSKWIDENGNNTKANLYNGPADRWGYPDAWLLMKWSKDWIPMGDEPVGAWVTNHWTWYSDDYAEETWYGWDTMNSFGEGTYMIKEFVKIMSVGDDMEAWLVYQAAGAYSAGWGSYASGVPRYVVFSDTITVYDAATGQVIASYPYVQGVKQGLGNPIF